jgi:hypothetical protein
MPHSQTHKGQLRKQKLETLLEKKEMAEEAHAELLKYNQVLNISKSKDKADAQATESKVPAPVYIKHSEDRERIAQNTFRDEEKPSSPAYGPDMLQSLFMFPFGIMSAFLESWMGMVSTLFFVPKADAGEDKAS